MPDKKAPSLLRRLWPRREGEALLIRRMGAAVVVSALIYLAGTAVAVSLSTRARLENCQSVREAFSAYTDTLAEFAGSSEERVAEFRAAYESKLKKCR